MWVPPFPVALRYLFDRYLELRASKSHGANGHNKVEWVDIQAYLSVTGSTLLPWEARLLRAIDDIFCREMAAGREATKTEAAEAAKDSVKNTAKRSRTVTRKQEDGG